MAQKNKARHHANYQITGKTTVTVVPNMPTQKKKEDAKQTLYINRI
jgi:hypothetical protein